jgi:hypothetical protein
VVPVDVARAACRADVIDVSEVLNDDDVELDTPAVVVLAVDEVLLVAAARVVPDVVACLTNR